MQLEYKAQQKGTAVGKWRQTKKREVDGKIDITKLKLNYLNRNKLYIYMYIYKSWTIRKKRR